MLDAPQTDWMEWQAGYVCGALLMPATAVRRVAAHLDGGEGAFGSLRSLTPRGETLVERLKEGFQVSGEAAKIRLLKLGLLAEEARR